MRSERYENLMKCHESAMGKVIMTIYMIRSFLPSRLFLLFPIPSFCRIIYMIHQSDISCRVCETDTMMFPLTPTPRARYRIWTRSSKFREIPTHVGDRFRTSFLAYRARTRTYAYHRLPPFATCDQQTRRARYVEWNFL